ncbi:hypothetical protein JOB18_004746 [Solea senegalensis]|uniref:Uncharacterized protein n=1 Tax=Solea senegalensis TaxID=28829 RepID=A0AAV6SS29_SOLSE|nr:hypothetical protein JOB18_004746 [Solea senegalensis]
MRVSTAAVRIRDEPRSRQECLFLFDHDNSAHEWEMHHHLLSCRREEEEEEAPAVPIC